MPKLMLSQYALDEVLPPGIWKCLSRSLVAWMFDVSLPVCCSGNNKRQSVHRHIFLN